MLAAFVIFLSAVVYRIQTDKGELIITTDEVSDSGKAARVVITERQQAVLQQLSRSTTVAFQLRQRAPDHNSSRRDNASP